MTETNAYGPGNNGQDYLTHPTSTGRATPILELAVRDPDGHDLPDRRAGRDLVQGPAPHPGLLEQAGGHRRDDRRRVAAQRRPRPRRRGRLRVRRGPRQGHGAAGGRERVLRRGGGGDLRAPGRARGRRVRRAPRAPRRGGGRGRLRPAPGSDADGRGAPGPRPRAPGRLQGARRVVRSSTRRSRATPPASSSSGTSATS